MNVSFLPKSLQRVALMLLGAGAVFYGGASAVGALDRQIEDTAAKVSESAIAPVRTDLQVEKAQEAARWEEILRRLKNIDDKLDGLHR